MNYPTYSGMYTGIVVQTNDPQKRGRVKIFVPHISPSVYEGWNSINKDKKFKFVGTNTYSDLTSVLEELKQVLPWAEYAAPLVGENSSGRYHRGSNVGSISDTSNIDTFVSDDKTANIDPSKVTKYSQNLDSIGEKPGNKYDIDLYRVNDAFNEPTSSKSNQVNKYSFNYIPEVYSNSAKGSFSIPSVGSHVWVFFTAGDPMFPVYFAASYGKEDWASIYDDGGLDYPGDFENLPLSGANAQTIDTDTYRNKYVVNQKGGTIQITNSDKRESIKFSHYSGSFKEFTNFVNIEFAAQNDQKLVLGDLFSTVRGGSNTFIQGESDSIIQGDSYIKIGNLRDDLHKQWYDLTREISNTKQLFDIKRAEAVVRNGLALTSPDQTQSGSYAPCPVCAGNETFYWNLNNTVGGVSFAVSMSEGGGPYFMGSVDKLGPQDLPKWGTFRQSGEIFGEACPACDGSGISPSSMDGKWVTEDTRSNIGQLISDKTSELAAIERQMGIGGSQIIDITKHKYETIGLVMNDSGSIRLDTKGKMYVSNIVIHPEGVFANRSPTPLIEYVQVDDLPGGNYTLNVCNKYTVQVGAGGLNLKSYGPVNISGSITNIAGEQVNIGSGNEVNIDGGNRVSIIADVVSLSQREKLQVVVDSSLGVNKNLVVGGGAHIEGELTVNHITAPAEIQETELNTVFGKPASIIPGVGIGGKIGTAATTFVCYTYDPITQTDKPNGVPAYIGVADPMIPVGYAYPGTIVSTGTDSGGDIVTVANTNLVPIFGSGIPSIRGTYLGILGTLVNGIRVYGSMADDDCLVMSPHSHNFKNLPLNLTEDNKETRERAESDNGSTRNAADPISNSKK